MAPLDLSIDKFRKLHASLGLRMYEANNRVVCLPLGVQNNNRSAVGLDNGILDTWPRNKTHASNSIPRELVLERHFNTKTVVSISQRTKL